MSHHHPTRELALQIDQACEGFGYFSGTSSVAIYGGGSGSDFDREKNALTTGVDIAIVTPGRMLSHMNLGYVDLSKIRCLILDEADRMLDMGFLGDINRITEHCNPDRQTLSVQRDHAGTHQQAGHHHAQGPCDGANRPLASCREGHAGGLPGTRRPEAQAAGQLAQGPRIGVRHRLFQPEALDLHHCAFTVQSRTERGLHQFRLGSKRQRRRHAPVPEPKSARAGRHRRREPRHRHRQH